jgi:hypothetical protein
LYWPIYLSGLNTVAIDIAIIVGLALTTLKLADFLFLPEQQQAIQDEFETLALEIDNADIGTLAARINSESTLRVFTVLTYFEFLLVAVIAYAAQSPEWQPGGTLAETFPGGRNHQFASLIISFVTLAFVWRWPLPHILRWITTKGTWFSMLLRFCGLVFTGLVVFGLYQLFALWILSSLGWCDEGQFSCGTAFMWAIHLIWPAFVVFWVATQCIGLLLQIRIPPVRWFARALLFLSKHTVWRIAVYNKGALAAVIALATFGLGALKVFL